MPNSLINEAKKVLAGKSGRLEDEELEYLAREITKLGFKLGYARAYAAGPNLIAKLIHQLERQEQQMDQIRKTLGF
jgi:flagellar biosynthesis/type III secretory pathway protein FliH